MNELTPRFSPLFAPKTRSRIEYGQGETNIYLAVPRRIASILFTAFFLAVGTVGGLFVALMMFAGTGDAAFFQAWLVLWSFGLMFVLVRFLWFLFGREKLIARNAGLDIVRSILWIPWKQHFPTNDVGTLRFIANDTTRSVKVNGRIIPQPAIGIMANGREIRLAHGITEAEARQVIEALKQRLVPSGRIGRRK